MSPRGIDGLFVGNQAARPFLMIASTFVGQRRSEENDDTDRNSELKFYTHEKRYDRHILSFSNPETTPRKIYAIFVADRQYAVIVAKSQVQLTVPSQTTGSTVLLLE
jgi:hypothetical protein